MALMLGAEYRKQGMSWYWLRILIKYSCLTGRAMAKTRSSVGVDDQSAALILVLLCDGQLNIGQLETESDPGLETHLQAVLTLVPTTNRQSVAKASGSRRLDTSHACSVRWEEGCIGGFTKHKGLPAFIIKKALHLAYTHNVCSSIASGKKKIFDLLVSRKADINLKDDDNNSLLLHLACEPDDTSILQTLLSQLDINIPGQHGWTPVMKAAVNGRKDVYDLLVKENADLKLTDDNGNNLLHLACHGGNVSIVKNLLPQFDINSRGGNGWTPVMYAVVNGHEILFHLLVSEGADLSLRDDYDNSVFHLGCLGGKRAIVKDLLQKADLNSQGNLGRTGVMKAAWAGNAEVFKLLVSKNADLKTLDDNKDTILHLSCQGGKSSIVDYLIGEGSDINCRGKHGWTAVMNAAWCGKKAAFHLLYSKQVSMSVNKLCPDTILHLACEGGNIPIVQSLLSTFDVNIRGKNGRTPVMAAAWAGKNEVIDLLMTMNPDLKLTDHYSNNILHLACRGGNTSVIEFLLPLFDITVPGEDGFTPLMMAASAGRRRRTICLQQEGPLSHCLPLRVIMFFMLLVKGKSGHCKGSG
ncbi:putative ankyrin repeat protein RF_0381 [Haliotis rubra]|uniref:putative ankyrin repeat protein RF_0381 n=1 Tax=Haliotis rubra TaxID=36100 RepID=UPI001EE56FBC|nr:putative ankyrin repeat protein RF_0381 [Haliotis rubra]